MNIILYVFDALRPDYLGCYGHDRPTSPNFDSFASENVLYRNAYSTSTWTKPAAASILSGQYPRSIRMLNQLDVLPQAVTTLPEVLSKEGFETYAVSGNMFVSPEFGFRAFDQIDVLQRDSEIQNKRRRTKEVDGRESNVLDKVGADEVVTVHSEDINERIFRILERNPDSDKLILAWTTDTHGPYYVRGDESYFGNPTDEFIEESEVERENLELVRSIYEDMIRHNDEQFGKLLDELKRRNEYDESLVIAASDHGESFGEKETVLGRPVTGHTGITYEEQIKIPLAIKYPDTSGPEVVTDLVQLTDLFPTILEMLDIDGVPDTNLDGRSLLNEKDDPESSRTIFAESKLNDIDIYSGCVRNGDMKLIEINNEIVLTRRWKRAVKGLLHVFQIPSTQLYNLSKDPREVENIAKDEPEILSRLQDRFEGIVEECNTSSDNISERDKADLENDVRQHLKSMGYLEE
jgi:arylsulfatase A-like enzyme